MSWYELELKAGMDDVSDRAWSEVWKVAYEGAAPDPTNGLFRARRGGAAVLLFPPAAADLARTFGGRPCRKPGADKLVFVAGAPQACDLHFPRLRIGRAGDPADAGAPQASPLPSSFLSTEPFSAFPSTQISPA